MSRIAITGVGIADTLGSNTTECWDNYQHKPHLPEAFRESHPATANLQCFYADHEWDKPESLPNPIASGTYAGLYKANKMALHTVNQALRDIPPSNNVGVVYSCVNPEGPTKLKYAMWLGGMGKRIKPRQQLQHLQSYTSGLISTHWDFNGASLTVGAACATSLYSIDYAIKLLEEEDDYDYVVVGGAEGSNDIWSLSYFNSLGALGTHSAPFDKNRDGFIMGEGSGSLVLETEEHAVARGAKIYGYIHSVGKSSDAAKSNPTSPDPDGAGIKLAMTRAMKRGINMDPYMVGSHWGNNNQLAFVNAHATSTPAGDDAEYKAIQYLFPGTPVVSFKSKIGHTMGSSGVLELIYTLLALQHQTVPGNHNITECDHKYVPTTSTHSTKKFALKNGLAFGGKNASVLLEVGPDLCS